jgi:hypothetical protein
VVHHSGDGPTGHGRQSPFSGCDSAAPPRCGMSSADPVLIDLEESVIGCRFDERDVSQIARTMESVYAADRADLNESLAGTWRDLPAWLQLPRQQRINTLRESGIDETDLGAPGILPSGVQRFFNEALEELRPSFVIDDVFGRSIEGRDLDAVLERAPRNTISGLSIMAVSGKGPTISLTLHLERGARSRSMLTARGTREDLRGPVGEIREIVSRRRHWIPRLLNNLSVQCALWFVAAVLGFFLYGDDLVWIGVHPAVAVVTYGLLVLPAGTHLVFWSPLRIWQTLVPAVTIHGWGRLARRRGLVRAGASAFLIAAAANLAIVDSAAR